MRRLKPLAAPGRRRGPMSYTDTSLTLTNLLAADAGHVDKPRGRTDTCPPYSHHTSPTALTRSNLIVCIFISCFLLDSPLGDCFVRVLSFLFLFTAVQQCPSPTLVSRYRIFQRQRHSFSLRFNHWATATLANLATKLVSEFMMPISISAKKHLGQYHK